jgi:hypothetical protein
MRRMIFAVAVFATLALTGIAAADGQHFTQNGFPLCTDIGTQVECTAEVAGLGNATVVANLSANGLATGLTCTTPSGSNQAPGQNPAVPVTGGGTQEIRNPKNGRASIDVTTATPTVTPKQAGCPNNHWIVIIDDVEFTTYTLTISQGNVILFTCNGSFDPSPSVDGQTSTPAC